MSQQPGDKSGKHVARTRRGKPGRSGGVYRNPAIRCGDDGVGALQQNHATFDFCGIEIDPDTAEIRIDKYVTIHDSGPLLNPGIAEGQIGGSFAYGLNTALCEEFVYGDDGSFLSGTFADYIVGTASVIPRFMSLHPTRPTASPWTASAQKVCRRATRPARRSASPTRWPMRLAASTSACRFGRRALPNGFTGRNSHRARRRRTLPRCRTAASFSLVGHGSMVVPGSCERVFQMLLDPNVLKRAIPGCHALEQRGDNAYHADVSLGAGPVRGRFDATVRLFELSPPHAASLEGRLIGPLGAAGGVGHIRLSEMATGTRADYDYEIAISGKIASIGGRMLDGPRAASLRCSSAG